MDDKRIYTLSRETLVRPSRRFIIPQAFIVGEILWVGIPASLETLLTSAAYIVNNNLAVMAGYIIFAPLIVGIFTDHAEAIMMTVSVLLLRSVIRREERRYTDC